MTRAVLASVALMLGATTGCDKIVGDDYSVGDGGGVDGSDAAAGDDAGADALPPPSCLADPTAFQPQWVAPTAFHQDKCARAQIDGWFTSCIDSTTRTTQACTAWSTSNSPCLACLITAGTATRWGPVINFSTPVSYYDLNVGGCVANAQNDPTGTGCGGKFAAAAECARLSCTNCTMADFFACTSVAVSRGACAKWNADWNDCMSSLTGDAAKCVPSGLNFAAGLDAVGPLFCGP